MGCTKGRDNRAGINGKYLIPIAVIAAVAMIAFAVVCIGNGEDAEHKTPSSTDSKYSGICGIGVSFDFNHDNHTLTIEKTGDPGRMYDFTSEDKSPWNGYKDSIEAVVIRDGVKSIGWNAFKDCTMLKSVTIPDSVDYIGGYAFELCGSLASVTIPSSVETIDYAAFNCCKSLKTVEIQDGVKCICPFAFDQCESIESIWIPGSITCIGMDAFWKCDNLKTIDVAGGASGIDADAFSSHRFFMRDGITPVNPGDIGFAGHTYKAVGSISCMVAQA